MKSKCPICNGFNSEEIFKSLDQPLARYGLCDSSEESLSVVKYPISLRKCSNCGLMYNSNFEYSKINYSSNRVQESRIFSPRIKSFMQESAKKLKRVLDLRSTEVIEIGCGDGYFLGLFSDESSVVGFEPSSEAEVAIKNNIRVVRDYYDPSINYDLEPNLIIMRQVLEHLENPVNFLKSFAELLSKRKSGGFIYIEVPNGGKTYDSNRFYDIYYEHYLYFTIQSLVALLEKCGFQVISCSEELDGEIISAIGVVNSLRSDSYYDFYHKIERLTSKINLIKSEGKNIASWGISGNGCALLNFCNFNASIIEHVIDSDKRKQGLFVPGTGQLVVSPEYLKNSPPDVVLILSQLHKKDIMAQIKEIYHSNVEIIIPDEL